MRCFYRESEFALVFGGFRDDRDNAFRGDFYLDPGEVGNTHWTYLTLVFGNCVGYIVIALVLLPLFYRQNLVSIYSWLGTRFGRRPG